MKCVFVLPAMLVQLYNIFSDMMQQGIDLQVKPHIVISTPGRLADHLQSCDTFSLRKIKFLVSGGVHFVTFISFKNSKSQTVWYLIFQLWIALLCKSQTFFIIIYMQVLDEADRLIEDDFGEQLETIFKVLPKKRQTLLFSATMTKHLKDLQDVAMNKPFFWQQKSEYVQLYLSVCLLNEDICVYS